jgi:ABC-type phosphonate transport system ATPase subunit
MKIEDQNNRMNHSDSSFFSGEKNDLQIIRVWVGTQQRLLLVRDGELTGFDVGNQGGGQN